MKKAYEVMTQGLITCAPDTSVVDTAGLMRDWDIGSVLVVDNGDLRGIVTDRDLTVHALADEEDPVETPIHKYMNKKVITGDVNWDLRKVARKMAKHQIRRLPILQDKRLVGIISLGDLSRHINRRGVVKKSLRAVSAPNGNSISSRPGHGATWLAMLGAIAGLSVAVAIWRSWRF